MIFAVLFFIPLLIAIGGFVFLKGITWKEFLVQVLAQVLIAGASAGLVYCVNTSDVEVWNGRVTSKASEHVSCSHSYSCNCRQECTGSGKDQRCSQVCDTCYEHSYDVDWNVFTSNGEQVEIDRIDRQGVDEPPRFTQVQIGEPTAVRHTYTSYIKAAPDTLFRHQGLKDRYAGSIPDYPGRVYDYYRMDRLVASGVGVPNPVEWNATLSEVNADLGAPRQANIIVVFTNQPRDWYYALEETWIGGKKNDIVLVVGVDQALSPIWVEVMAWTIDPTFKVKLRDDMLAQGALTPKKVADALRRNVLTYHKRKPMKDFEYLKASIVPSTTQWVITLILGILSAIGLAWLFEVHDPFGDETFSRHGFGRRRGLDDEIPFMRGFRWPSLFKRKRHPWDY